MSTHTETYTQDDKFEVADIGYEVKVTEIKKAVSISNHLPPLPLKTYHKITSWLSDVTKTHDTEGVCSLTIVDNEWKVIVWHQEAPNSLHVDYDESSEENQKLLDDVTRQALKTVHCTIHSHNKAAASQSSNDQDDERTKKGWHITVGNCDKAQYSTHARFNITRDAIFGKNKKNMGKKISDAHQEFVNVDLDIILEDINIEGVNNQYLVPVNSIAKINIETPYPEEWLDRVTIPPKTFTGKYSLSSSGYSHHHNNYNGYKKKAIDTPPSGKKTNDDYFTSYINHSNIKWALCQALYEVSSASKKKLEESLVISNIDDKNIYMICKKARKTAIKLTSKKLNVPTKQLSENLISSEDLAVALVDLQFVDDISEVYHYFEPEKDKQIIRKLYEEMNMSHSPYEFS